MSIDTLVIDVEDWLGEDVCTIGDVGFGVLAEDIPLTGEAGPSLLANDIKPEDPLGCEYRVEILTLPSAGNLFVFENGAVRFSDAPDGVYIGTQRVWKSGIPGTEATYTLTVGGNALAAAAGCAATVTALLTTAIRLAAVATANASSTAMLSASDIQLAAVAASSASATADLTTEITLSAYAASSAMCLAALGDEVAYVSAPDGNGYTSKSFRNETRPANIQRNYR